LNVNFFQKDLCYGSDIYNVLTTAHQVPNGLAVLDGRLRPDDRILEVNGVDLTFSTQEQVAAVIQVGEWRGPHLQYSGTSGCCHTGR